MGTSNRAGGFSLLEMVVSISLVAFVLMSIVGLIPTGLRSLARSDQVQAATLYASEVLENTIYDVQDNPSNVVGNPITAQVMLNKTQYTVNRNVTRIDNLGGPIPSLVEIDVTVSWNGQPVPVSLGTRVYLSN